MTYEEIYVDFEKENDTKIYVDLIDRCRTCVTVKDKELLGIVKIKLLLEKDKHLVYIKRLKSSLYPRLSTKKKFLSNKLEIKDKKWIVEMNYKNKIVVKHEQHYLTNIIKLFYEINLEDDVLGTMNIEILLGAEK